jgi:hypothetical protein
VLKHRQPDHLAHGGGTGSRGIRCPGMARQGMARPDAVTIEEGQRGRPATMTHKVATGMTETASSRFAAVRYCRLS